MTRPRTISIAVVAVIAIAVVIWHRGVIAWFTGAALDPSRGEGAAAVVTAGAWQIGVALAPDPPRAEGQAAVVTIRDRAGAPVAGAAVEVTYDMPAMGAMAEMKATFAASPTGGGGYRAAFDLPMAGTWSLWVQAKTADACVVARFTFTIGQPGAAGEGASACGQAGDAAIQIDDARQRELGITTAPVTRGPLAVAIRAVGKLTYDESRLTDVVLKVSGYVSDLRVRAVGQAVRTGEPLFRVYSPELFAAEQDYLVARQSGEAFAAGGLVRAAETKLALLGVAASDVRAIADRGAALEQLAVRAPATGVIIDKAVVEGDAVAAGQRLFRIAALDRVWVEADLFAADLARVAPGMAAEVALGDAPPLAGKVAMIYPYLDAQTRTGRVRIELANPGRALKPDMYASVTFAVPLADRLSVPRAAVVYPGPRRVVFVALAGGKLAPRDVTLGAEAGDRVEITHGLAEGDVVVTSGNFLVAAESRLRGAL
jgi:Cu(I)/Ag(I) efflux system membrane fusion protein